VEPAPGRGHGPLLAPDAAVRLNPGLKAVPEGANYTTVWTKRQCARPPSISLALRILLAAFRAGLELPGSAA